MPEIKTPMIPPPPEEATPLPEIRPWSRQQGEPEEAWQAFLQYRDSHRPRRLARPGTLPTAKLRDLYHAWQWEQRVEAFDRHLDTVRLSIIEKALEDDAREVAAEHRMMLRDARELAAIVYDRLLKDARASEFATMKPAEAIRLIESTIKLERLIRGEATEIQGKAGPDLSKLTLEELRAATELADKMDDKDPSPTTH